MKSVKAIRSVNSVRRASPVRTFPGSGDFLELIWSGSASSRAEAARLLDLSRPTVSGMAERLLHAGILRENGRGKSSGGKPPVLLEISGDAFSSIGLDLGYEGTACGVLLDARKRIVKHAEVPGGKGFREMLESAERLIRMLDDGKAAGVGAAVSAIVRPSDGRILESAHFDLADRPFREELEKRSRFPVVIDNRGRMSARSELLGGEASDGEGFVLLSLGRSIGAAVCLDGRRLYTGKNGMAGEIRNLKVGLFPSGGEALMSLEEVMDCSFRRKNRITEKQCALYCAEGLCRILDLLDLRRIILSGRFAEFGKTFHSLLKSEMQERASCKVLLSRFGRFGAARGAAAAAVERFVLHPGDFPPVRRNGGASGCGGAPRLI